MGAGADDPWYLTAIDFATGRTVWKQHTGDGFGFNNNYAPLTIGPDGTAYVGVLGGLVAARDRTPPQAHAAPAPRLVLRARAVTGTRARPALGGRDASRVLRRRLPR